jgi:hypothetical protein
MVAYADDVAHKSQGGRLTRVGPDEAASFDVRDLERHRVGQGRAGRHNLGDHDLISPIRLGFPARRPRRPLQQGHRKGTHGQNDTDDEHVHHDVPAHCRSSAAPRSSGRTRILTRQVLPHAETVVLLRCAPLQHLADVTRGIRDIPDAAAASHLLACKNASVRLRVDHQCRTAGAGVWLLRTQRSRGDCRRWVRLRSWLSNAPGRG